MVRLVSAVLLIGSLTAISTSIAAAGESYSIGIDFITEATPVDTQYWVHFGDPGPFPLTDPANSFVLDGALAGMSEAEAQRDVVLHIEDYFRRIDTGDPAGTLNLRIFEGQAPLESRTRELNVMMCESTLYESSYGFADGLGIGFEEDDHHPDGAYGAFVFLDNIDRMEDVAFDSTRKFHNAVSGIAAHEIGHLYNLEHVERGDSLPYNLMSTGSTGMTSTDWVEDRAFSSDAEEADNIALLLSGLGTIQRGDFDADGDLDTDDASVLIANFGKDRLLYHEGDADGDHDCDLDDASLLLSGWGGMAAQEGGDAESLTAQTDLDALSVLSAGQASVSVPEPGIGMLLLVGACGLLGKKRKVKQ